jgi:hypothetical protein
MRTIVKLNNSKEEQQWRAKVLPNGCVIGQVRWSPWSNWRDSATWFFTPEKIKEILAMKRDGSDRYGFVFRRREGSYEVGCQRVSRGTVLKIYKLSQSAAKAWKRKGIKR